jgi:putative ABC transport system permease protein
VVPLREALVGSADRPIRLLWLATLAMWLLACTNIAWLLVARAAGERQEIAVRRALGSSLGRLVAPWLHESAIVVAASTFAGAALAVWCSRWLSTALGSSNTIGPPTLDSRALGATILCAVVTLAILMAIPALVAMRTSAVLAIRPAASGGTRIGLGSAATSMVIAGQVAGAVVLSWAAIVLLQSLDRAARVDLGFKPRDLYVVTLRLPPYAYRDEARIRGIYGDILADVRSLPGVKDAAVALAHPLQAGFSTSFQVAGDASGIERRARLRAVSDRYFRTVDTPVLSGRAIEPGDRADGARVAVVNEAFAREFFQGDAVIGQRLLRRSFGQPNLLASEIVGVVSNERFAGPQGAPEPAIYVPFEQMPFTSSNLLVRISRPATAGLTASVRSVVWRHERAVPVEALRSMEEVASAFLATPRTLSNVLVAFGGIAAVLVMIGIHGILAQTLSLRRRELAIRRALGATHGDVIGNVASRATGAVGLGLGVGALLVLLSARTLRPFVFEIGMTDPLVAVSTTLFILTTVAIGVAAPAWRAAQVSPADALRE